jgi:hypothetical protein
MDLTLGFGPQFGNPDFQILAEIIGLSCDPDGSCSTSTGYNSSGDAPDVGPQLTPSAVAILGGAGQLASPINFTQGIVTGLAQSAWQGYMAVGNVITNARESLDNPSGNILLNVGAIALALAAGHPEPLAEEGGELGDALGSLPELSISASKYPDLAENIFHAQAAGHPQILTFGGNAAANRAAALEGVPNILSLSRDEYPFASSMEGGAGAWVGHIPPSQQNAQGALIRNFINGNNIRPGSQYKVTIVP